MSASAPRIMIEPSWRGRVFGAEWRNAVGSTFDMIQPATGAAITRVGNASAEDVRQVAAHAIRLGGASLTSDPRHASMKGGCRR